MTTQTQSPIAVEMNADVARAWTRVFKAQAEWSRVAGAGVRAWLGATAAPLAALVAAPTATEKETRSVEDVVPGFEFTYTRVVSDGDIRAFADATGDHNPLHLDDAYARSTAFKGRIAHGMLTGGLISAALARLPGVVVYVSQNFAFLRPVRPGEEVTARVTVIERVPGKRSCRLRTTCESGGHLVLEGEAVVLILPES